MTKMTKYDENDGKWVKSEQQHKRFQDRDAALLAVKNKPLETFIPPFMYPLHIGMAHFVMEEPNKKYCV